MEAICGNCRILRITNIPWQEVLKIVSVVCKAANIDFGSFALSRQIRANARPVPVSYREVANLDTDEERER